MTEEIYDLQQKCDYLGRSFVGAAFDSALAGMRGYTRNNTTVSATRLTTTRPNIAISNGQSLSETHMLISDYRALCPVALPYDGRQKYMHSFDLAAPKMADGFEDYLEPVTALCVAAGATSGTAHMTVDEKIVEAGMSQRRPKPHVDGRFLAPTEAVYASFGPVGGGGVWGHSGGGSGWAHYCNNIPGGRLGRMSVIVASSAVGCRAWRGTFQGKPRSDGDLTHIIDQLGIGEVLPPNVGYLLSPDCVHESMIMDRPTKRTFLRIALPMEYQYES